MIRFRVISGTVSVTENLYLYEYLPDGKMVSDMMILDCGIGFPDMEMYGVDLVIPDFSYIKQNEKALRGIVLSQGHEDHQGALPFLLNEVSAPVYGSPLTIAFVEDKLKEYQLKSFNPEKDILTIGPFKITPFRVNHSVPDTVGFSIDTPEGQIMHIAEHKFDPDPVDGHRFDKEKAKSLASKGVLMLASDCLGSNKPGRTPSERSIKETIERIVAGAKGAVYFTTISSNIGRMQQVVEVAEKYNRKVVYVGRSIQKKAEVSLEMGYMKHKRETVISLKEAKKYGGRQIIYIIAG